MLKRRLSCLTRRHLLTLSYQRLLEIAEKLETIEALKPVIEEMKAGKGETAEKVFAELLREKVS